MSRLFNIQAKDNQIVDILSNVSSHSITSLAQHQRDALSGLQNIDPQIPLPPGVQSILTSPTLKALTSAKQAVLYTTSEWVFYLF